MSLTLEMWNQATQLSIPHGGAGHILAEGDVKFPDPPAVELPEKAQSGLDYFIGTLKTILYAAAVVAGLFVAMAMIAGMRGRSNFAKDAVTHLPWLFGGVIFAGVLTAVLSKFA